MARVNVGVNPKYLSDQHLIAESVEITMIVGGLSKNNWIIKGSIPTKFTLGTGHINFFKNKLKYLEKRLSLVNEEMNNRGFKVGNTLEHYNLASKPLLYRNWCPTTSDSKIVRKRITERLQAPLKAKANFHRFKKQPITNLVEFCETLEGSDLCKC